MATSLGERAHDGDVHDVDAWSGTPELDRSNTAE